MSKPLPCIVCGCDLPEALPGSDNYNQPHGATVFTAHGQYGSTVWDPMMPNRFLEINVCDPCLTDRKERVVQVFAMPTCEYDTRPWTGPDEEVM